MREEGAVLSHRSLATPGGQAPRHGDLEALPYTTQAVKEVLRLYPAIPIFPREAAAADRLPSGHRVEAGEHDRMRVSADPLWRPGAPERTP